MKRKLKDFIVDPKGQWNHPGKKTYIPNANGSITMRGVKYPVLGIDDQGNQQMMYPDQEYQFPGDGVYEIPMAQRGMQSGKDPDKLYQEYLKLQKEVNLRQKEEDLYQEHLYNTLLPLNNTDVTKTGFIPKSVLNWKDPITGKKAAFCISGVCHALTQNGEPITYFSNTKFQDDVVAGKVPGRYLDQSEKGLKSGDILQFNYSEGMPFHAFLVTKIHEPDEKGIRKVDVFGNHGSGYQRFDAYFLDEKNKIFKYNDVNHKKEYKDTQVIKREVDPRLHQSLIERDNIKKELEDAYPMAFRDLKVNTDIFTPTAFVKNENKGNKINLGNPGLPSETINLNDSKLDEILTQFSNPDFKKKFMKQQQVNNDEYDAIVKNVIGIYGAESKFGTGYAKEPLWLQRNFDMIKSVGPFQINPKMLQTNRFSRKDLFDPVVGSEAAATFLAENLPLLRSRAKAMPGDKNYSENLHQDNYLEYLPYLMNQQGLLKGDEYTKEKKPGRLARFFGAESTPTPEDKLTGNSEYNQRVKDYIELLGLEGIPASSPNVFETPVEEPQYQSGGTFDPDTDEFIGFSDELPKAQEGLETEDKTSILEKRSGVPMEGYTPPTYPLGKKRGLPELDQKYQIDKVQEVYGMYNEKAPFLKNWFSDPSTGDRLKSNLQSGKNTRNIDPKELTDHAIEMLNNTPMFSRELARNKGVSLKDIQYSNQLQGWGTAEQFGTNPYFTGYDWFGGKNLGQMNRDTGQIMVDTLNDHGTVAHEGTHVDGEFQNTMESIINQMYGNKKDTAAGYDKYLKSMGFSKGMMKDKESMKNLKQNWNNTEQYLNRDGMFPRIMDIRSTLKLQSGQPVDKSILNNPSISHPLEDLRHYYDDDTIIKMLNELASNDKQSPLDRFIPQDDIQKAQTGLQTGYQKMAPASTAVNTNLTQIDPTKFPNDINTTFKSTFKTPYQELESLNAVARGNYSDHMVDLDRWPTLSGKTINLTTDRYRGANVPVEYIDMLNDSAKRFKIDPYLLYAIAGRESTFGQGLDKNKERQISPINIVSGWNIAENYTPYDYERFLADNKTPYIKVQKDKRGYIYNTDYGDDYEGSMSEMNNYIKNNNLVNKYKKKLESTPKNNYTNPYDFLSEFITKNGIEKYNPGDHDYKNKINNEIALLKKDPEFSKYINSINKRALVNKQKGGTTNTLEGDLISKVIMNRNRDKDFVRRTYAVGEYPESNMFVQSDVNEFGQKNSHLMSWGEDESGQAYMYPEVMNPNNEAIKVPNQYADYISSIGYKKATGIPYAEGGTFNPDTDEFIGYTDELDIYQKGGNNDLGKILADLRKQTAKPVGNFSDWNTQSTKPASTLPTAQENFINASKDIPRNRKPVKTGIHYTTREEMAARPYPASGSLTPVYPEALLMAGPAVNMAKSAITSMALPFSVGSTTIPWLTGNNLLTSYFASKVPSNLQQGEYIDATLNGLPMVGPIVKESYNAAKTALKQLPGSSNVSRLPNNPTFGNPIGNAQDLHPIDPNSKIWRDPATGEIVYYLNKGDYPFANDWETIASNDFKDYINSWLNMKPRIGGYSEIPQFNRMLKSLITQASFGKRTGIKSFNELKEVDKAKQEMDRLRYWGPSVTDLNPSDEFYKMWFPGGGKAEVSPNSIPFTGIEAFQKIHPNKYGGSIYKNGGSYNPNTDEFIGYSNELDRYQKGKQVKRNWDLPEGFGGYQKMEPSSTRVAPVVNHVKEAQYRAQAAKDVANPNINDDDFRDKHGYNKHVYKMNNDPKYRAEVETNAKELVKRNGSIDLPSTYMDSKSYVGNPNSAFMNPNNLTGEAAKANEEFHGNVINAFLPIPGLQQIGKVPSVFKAVGKTLDKFGNVITTQTPLRNAYKLNPWSFQNTVNEMKPSSEFAYRTLGRQEGFENTLNSGLITPKPGGAYDTQHGAAFYNANYPLLRYSDDLTYIDGKFIAKDGPKYIAEVPLSNPKVVSRYADGLDKYRITKGTNEGGLGHVGINEPGVTIYKEDWLRGFKPVDNIPINSNEVAKIPVPKAWEMEELPGLHLKSTMSDNPQGLHKYLAKDGTIETKSALEHIKRMEGDSKYDIVLKNMQERFGTNLENMPKRMDYNTFRKNIQEDLWDVGTGKGVPVDQYAGMDMKEFGIIKNDEPWLTGPMLESHIQSSLGYDRSEVAIDGYSFMNKDKFIGGSNAHSMPEETLGHTRGFTNPNEPDIYYSAERQSNWAQEAGSTLKQTDIELLKKQKETLPKLIKEQEDLIAAGNDTWAHGQKERLEGQLKNVEETINSYNRYSSASPQEKLVMKNMNERMLQEDVAHIASKGYSKYRMPTEETMAKIQGFKKGKDFDMSLLTPRERIERIHLLEEYKGMPENVSDELWDEVYNPIYKKIEALNKKGLAEVDYSSGQKSILKHTSQSLKDAEKLFGVKLNPVTDSKGNTWFEFDIPEKFRKGKAEIKALALGGAIVGTRKLKSKKQEGSYNPNTDEFLGFVD